MLLHAWLILCHHEGFFKNKSFFFFFLVLFFFPYCSFPLVLVTLGDNRNVEHIGQKKMTHSQEKMTHNQGSCSSCVLGLRFWGCCLARQEPWKRSVSPNVRQDLNLLLSVPDLANKAHLNSKDMSCFSVLCLQKQQPGLLEAHEMSQTGLKKMETHLSASDEVADMELLCHEESSLTVKFTNYIMLGCHTQCMSTRQPQYCQVWPSARRTLWLIWAHSGCKRSQD